MLYYHVFYTIYFKEVKGIYLTVYCYYFREYLIDLVGNPGSLREPDSLLNGPSSISISSPLRFPRLKASEPAIDFGTLAKQYFSDTQALNLVFDEPSPGISQFHTLTLNTKNLHRSMFM